MWVSAACQHMMSRDTIGGCQQPVNTWCHVIQDVGVSSLSTHDVTWYNMWMSAACQHMISHDTRCGCQQPVNTWCHMIPDVGVSSLSTHDVTWYQMWVSAACQHMMSHDTICGCQQPVNTWYHMIQDVGVSSLSTHDVTWYKMWVSAACLHTTSHDTRWGCQQPVNVYWPWQWCPHWHQGPGWSRLSRDWVQLACVGTSQNTSAAAAWPAPGGGWADHCECQVPVCQAGNTLDGPANTCGYLHVVVYTLKGGINGTCT